jgi:hypothetical protein
VVYAARYVISLDSRAARYQSAPGYDVADWLNTHVRFGERVAIGNFNGHKYFIEPKLLLSSESPEEFQWLWEHGRWFYAGSGSITPRVWNADFWHLYVDQGFTYVVIRKDRLQNALSAWPANLREAHPRVIIVGVDNAIVKIERR